MRLSIGNVKLTISCKDLRIGKRGVNLDASRITKRNYPGCVWQALSRQGGGRCEAPLQKCGPDAKVSEDKTGSPSVWATVSLLAVVIPPWHQCGVNARNFPNTPMLPSLASDCQGTLHMDWAAVRFLASCCTENSCWPVYPTIHKPAQYIPF